MSLDNKLLILQSPRCPLFKETPDIRRNLPTDQLGRKLQAPQLRDTNRDRDSVFISGTQGKERMRTDSTLVFSGHGLPGTCVLTDRIFCLCLTSLLSY